MAMQGDEHVIFSEGAILGVDQFLFGSMWDHDIFCKEQATICKLKYESLANLVATHNATAAARLFKRVVRHFCYDQIFQKKAQNQEKFD